MATTSGVRASSMLLEAFLLGRPYLGSALTVVGAQRTKRTRKIISTKKEKSAESGTTSKVPIRAELEAPRHTSSIASTPKSASSKRARFRSNRRTSRSCLPLPALDVVAADDSTEGGSVAHPLRCPNIASIAMAPPVLCIAPCPCFGASSDRSVRHSPRRSLASATCSHLAAAGTEAGGHRPLVALVCSGERRSLLRRRRRARTAVNSR